jgi:hypothetical protein
MASGCASSDVSVRLESELLSHSHSLDACVAIAIRSCPTTRHGGALGERRYSSYSFSISALDGGDSSDSRPGRNLAPGKGPPVPIVQEAGWA